MGKKRKKHAAAAAKRKEWWCYYCDREFEEAAVLLRHQKARHFRCGACHKQLSSAAGMANHALQVHKRAISKVPNAKPDRDSIEIEIFGMDGIPPEALAAPYGNDEDSTSKQAIMEVLGLTPTINVPTQFGIGFPQPLFSALPPTYNPVLPGWSLPARPHPWLPPLEAIPCPPEARMIAPKRPLIPIQNAVPLIPTYVAPKV